MPDQRRAATRGAVRFYSVVFAQECLGMSSMSGMQELVATCGDNREAVTQRRHFTLPSHNRTSSLAGVYSCRTGCVLGDAVYR